MQLYLQWPLNIFVLFSYSFVINTIILWFNGPILSKMAPFCRQKTRETTKLFEAFFLAQKFELTVNYRELLCLFFLAKCKWGEFIYFNIV